MLAILTPTRRRWSNLVEQAAALRSQLADEDRWLIAVDDDEINERDWRDIQAFVGPEKLVLCHVIYRRPETPVGWTNRLRNALAQLAPSDADLVEFDDHDIATPYALAEIRAAFNGGYHYIFGWYHQRALLDGPAGEQITERWPDVTHTYYPGGFQRGDVEAIGPRAISRDLWRQLGGLDQRAWPLADFDFARRAEAAGASIVALEHFLSTVTVCADSMAARYRGAPGGQLA